MMYDLTKDILYVRISITNEREVRVMRTIHVINLSSNHVMTQYSVDHMKDALDDITASGFNAINIKFDFEGDIVIECIPII